MFTRSTYSKLSNNLFNSQNVPDDDYDIVEFPMHKKDLANLYNNIESYSSPSEYDSMRLLDVPDFVVDFLKLYVQDNKSSNVLNVHPYEFGKQDKKGPRILFEKNLDMGHAVVLAMLPTHGLKYGLYDKLFFVAHLGGSDAIECNNNYAHFRVQNIYTLGDKCLDFKSALDLLSNFTDFCDPAYFGKYVDY